MEKKSALTAKLYSASLNKDVLPPITTNTKRKTSDNTDANGNSMAYQVTFDENDKIKTKKTSKFSAPLNMIAPTRNQDERYILIFISLQHSPLLFNAIYFLNIIISPC